MTSLIQRVTSGSRAAALAAMLAATGLAALPAPAMAQSGPSFNFQLGIGNDGSGLSFGINNDRRDIRPPRSCLNDRQVVRGLRHYGFRDVELLRNLRRNRVEAYGEWRGRGYIMKVDRCSGEVYDIERLRRRDRWDDRWDDDRRDDGPRFEFRFGN